MKTDAAEDRLLGQTVAGKYRLSAVHAAGAFGTVFQAEQSFCGQFVRTVAVKVSRATGLTEQTAPHLFSDALILARLMAGGHRDGKQHLVPIYDMGLLPEHGGRGFLVMEFVEGHPLFAHIHAAGRIGVPSGLRYVKEICRALALMHSQGAVHRDLKPDNVLIDRAGVVRLVDFGLATFTDAHLGFAPGALGTFTYMAPETLLGRSRAASDVYGLGLLMYELFTGDGPHRHAPWPARGDDRGEEHYRIKTTLQFDPPSAVHNEIRNEYRWLDALILRCLDAKPSKRFRDAGALLAAIEACESGGELPPPEESHEPDPADDPTPAPLPAPVAPDHEDLVRDVRRLLGRKAYEQVIERLEVHRPAEWATLDGPTARLVRLLAQGYIGRGAWGDARDCLEQVRDGQKEQPVLTRAEYTAVLSDLVKCYDRLDLTEQAEACRREVHESRRQ
jgi:serine/threonine protein kinase